MATLSPGQLTATKVARPYTPYRTMFDIGNIGISRLNKPEDFLNALKLSALLFACVHLRASTIAKYDLRALTPDNTEVFGTHPTTSNRRHKLYRLLQQPNPYQTRYEFLYTVQMSLDLLGNCLVLLDGVDGLYGLPTSLWPLDPSRCQPAFGDDGLIGYLFKDSNYQDQLIPVDRVLHFKRPSPVSIYWGLGIAEVVAKEINIQAALTEYISQFFNQGTQPSGILVAKDTLTDEVFERLKLESLAMMTGSQNAHRMAVMDSGVDFKQLSANLKDLGTNDLDVMLMKKILTAFEVPGTKFGLIEFASYKAEDMERSFTDAMESVARLLEGTLNRLAGLYDKKGKPVPKPEMEAVRRGTLPAYDGDVKGIALGFVIPSRDPLATLVDMAVKLSTIPSLTPEEQRNGVLHLLGNILTAPSGFKNDTPPPPQAQAATPAPATPAKPADGAGDANAGN